SAIRGAAELLEEDMLPEQRQKFLDNLRSETARIQDLIDRMLLLAAVENRKELRDAEEINLESLLTEVIAEMQPALVSKEVRVTLQSEDEIVVVGERFLLTQALANLLQNALDFSSQGSKIQIKISQGEANARIVIQDAGPGIPDYALDKIFDRFYSLSRPNTGKKSSGLGLALVREVATLHHGHVTLENLPSGGAQATLELPQQ
ncbi:MAG: ATP-binding protein, partial [Candidatus Hydrogenedentes bacterium]|nr:ATP-binding protein [Candidatus Hydrogenedentota bacterium]